MMKATMPILALTAWLVIGICSAMPPVPDGSYPEIPAPDGHMGDHDWSEYPMGEYPAGEYPMAEYPMPDSPTPGSVPSGYDYPLPSDGDSSSDHPSSGPSISQPVSAPQADLVQPLTYLSQGQSLSPQEVSATGGLQAVSGLMTEGGSSEAGSYAYSGGKSMEAKAMAFTFSPATTFGPQLWARYNGAWTAGPASVFLHGWTNMLVKNDQRQRIWSWEKYPGGAQRWSYWGLRMPGYFSGQFIGDTRGWHYLAMWGGRSGWSNVVPVFVWW